MSAARQLVMVTRESRGPLDTPLGHELRRIEERIGANEGDSIEARWEFGRALLRFRQGKQLPKGLPAAIKKEHGISQSEITRRMQFAELCTTKAEVLHTVHDFPSWRQIVSKALPKNPAQPKATTFEQRMNDRVTRMINDAKTKHDRRILAQILADASQQIMENVK